ncbi:aldo/keto reductase [Eubacteriales bacterium OttesenSCG-928-G02]|nr:aldo/keto reductase [Eubacteriales bacterium OttesenSCG-928-G02]
MEYRIHNKTGNKVSLLGFGCMRLPLMKQGETEVIDKELTERLFDYAYKNGVNYYDTAYGYLEGKSEIVTGEILKKYPRDTYFLADKMPTWHAKSLDDAKRIFAEQLEKCKVDYFDYYLCHAVSRMDDYKNVYQKNGVYDYLNSEKQQGRIKNLGFSFHGDYELFEYMMDDHDWDFVQIQVNYYDWDYQDAKKLYKKACDKNVQCIIMEPVRGGALATLTPEAVEILKKAEPQKSPASWAIRYAASLDNVLCVLSGMSNLEQVVDNIETIKNFKKLDETDNKTIQKALEAYLKNEIIPCTGCRYCMDCPAGVDIPGNFMSYNKAASENTLPYSIDGSDFAKKCASFKSKFASISESALPHNCIDCKACVSLCPQSIDIPQNMQKINSLLNKS